MKCEITKWRKDGYTLRLATFDDAEAYYENNFHPLSPETARLTGCKPNFTHDEVVNFLKRCITAFDRYDFLILSPDNQIIGESVLNEIDESTRCANFRIALFHETTYGKGIGSWAIEKTLEFAFEELKLHRVELNVFSFNPRAIHTYKKLGFKQEGILRDAIKNEEGYADDILMAILEDEYREMKK